MSLQKEMVLAIVLGLLLGGGVAFALVTMPNSNSSTGQPSTTPADLTSQPASPTSFVTEPLTIEILLPENQTLTTDSEITISGKTRPGATVVLSTSLDESILKAEDDGTFSERVSLEEGSNEVLIVSHLEDQTVEKRLIVNYTKEEL